MTKFKKQLNFVKEVWQMAKMNPISFRPDPEVQKKLEDYSAKEGRSISNVINYALRIFFKLNINLKQKVIK